VISVQNTFAGMGQLARIQELTARSLPVSVVARKWNTEAFAIRALFI